MLRMYPGGDMRRSRVCARTLSVGLVLLCGMPAVSFASVTLDVDLERFRLEAVDVRGKRLSLRVAIGSPRHPTPRGSFRLARLIQRPAWHPGTEARRRGGRPTPATWDGPMGVAKIPFRGAFAVHGGAEPIEVGKPVTLGCIQLSDESMRQLIEWLDARGVLSGSQPQASGEIHVRFREPAALQIR